MKARLGLAVGILALSGCATVQEKLRHMGVELAAPRGSHALNTAVAGCSAAEKAPYEMDAEKEYFFGRAIGARMLGDLGVKPLPTSDPVASYIDRVGQLVALSSEVERDATASERARHAFSQNVDDRPWPLTGYHFIVLPMEEPNAFGSPGGLVTITTGLLKKLRSEDELAGVLAHEVVHVQRGHGVEVMKAHLCQAEAQGKVAKAAGAEVNQAVSNVGKSLGGAAFKNKSAVELGEMLESALKGVLGVFSKGYPKDLELEADRMAVRLLVTSGYSPAAFEDLLLRMKAEAKGRDKYLETHPPFDDRVRTVRPALAKFDKALQVRPAADVALRAARFEEAMKPLQAPGSTTAQGSR